MSSPSKHSLSWSLLSILINGLLILVVAHLWQRKQPVSQVALANFSGLSMQLLAKTPFSEENAFGTRQRLTYEQWRELLAQEAAIAARDQPDNLAVLLGDSITLWFSRNYLPPHQTWLNQGISGEKTMGLLRRLEFLDETDPQVIFIMIGINDILWDVEDATLLSNYRLIIRYLKTVHPDTEIVIQSILPHAGEQATWEGKERLLANPNTRIQRLNRELKTMADEENVLFLNLYPLFADEQGALKLELTTDGLHLNGEGYEVWSTALQLFSDLVFKAES
ncbi:GDSL-type esterase/lipase family protein [Spirulina sp. CS-785/01]|uniref:GDSL-type esterase/lipase family protein n=1 Tax=Spirulina sp. CS-785/01 TaxID=3021716 RepID=UPI00232F5600|nr:GDSL-type esterase/lipase family protein [Spirulina sp. CS-785/01]MDB9313394.1 GDSL-type esterase/lipase family protein [Spirulina sp. CS-785/01]